MKIFKKIYNTKKIETKEDPKEEIKNNLDYSGKVTITTIGSKNKLLGRRTIKNEGTANLFQSICRYLAGYFGLSDSIPGQVDLRVDDISLLITPSYITSKIVKDTYDDKGNLSGSKVVFTALIGSGQVNIELKGDKTCTLVLQTLEPRPRDLATITIVAPEGTTDGLTIISGTSIVIEWEMTVGNPIITSNTKEADS